eukprot:2491192-Pyramimonas_sp.AAC.1
MRVGASASSRGATPASLLNAPAPPRSGGDASSTAQAGLAAQPGGIFDASDGKWAGAQVVRRSPASRTTGPPHWKAAL